jgi:hypothetical protein
MVTRLSEFGAASAFALVLMLSACSSDDDPASACSPGKQEACACPGGQQGAQRCKDDGSGWGACSCPDGGSLDAPDDSAPVEDATDGSVPDGSVPDGSVPDGSVPDGSVPDGSVPDATDGSVPDGSVPDASDGSVPDGSVPDASDGSVPDGSVPDASDGSVPPDAQISTCDPVLQDCLDAAEACYLTALTGVASCAGFPAGAEGVVQDDPCYGPSSGGCYLNGCDKGYGANLPDDTCAFFCNPTDNWAGNVNGLSGDPAGITCAASFGGVRPDGPGPAYECRYIQSYYSNTEQVAATTGMCVSPGISYQGFHSGSCADFDWVRLQSDIADDTASQTGYCDTICPECCMVECISLATFDAAVSKTKKLADYTCFVGDRAIRDTCGYK